MEEDSIQAFIKDKSALFWWIPESKKKNISLELLVESILNYGNEKEVRCLFDLIGTEKAAKIFYKLIAGNRLNYHPKTINYFKLYFEEHV